MASSYCRVKRRRPLTTSIIVVALLALTMLLAGFAVAQRNKPPPQQQQQPQTPERGIREELKKQQPPEVKKQAETRAMGLVNALPGKSKRYALVIGIDQYSDSQMMTLGGATNDARMLADALVRYAGFPPDQVVLLASDQPAERKPTRGNILRRLSNLAAVVPKDGLLLFSFAGHGIERNQQAFLLPSDAQVSNDVNLLEQTAINVLQIRDWIRKTGVGQVLLMLDACRNDPSAGRASADNPLTKSYTRGFDFNVRNHEVTAFATLYATEIGNRAYEYKEQRQGYFTWALVEGLKGKAANENGEVTLSALIKYLQDTVPRRVLFDLGQGRSQRPFAVVEGYKANELVLSVKGVMTTSADSPLPAITPDATEPTPTESTGTTSSPGGREIERQNTGDLSSTTWTGNSPEAGEYAIEFLKEGQLRYLITVLENGERKQKAVKGTWRQAGDSVQIVIGNSYSVLQGKIDGAIMRGEGENLEGAKWKWVLLKKAP